MKSDPHAFQLESIISQSERKSRREFIFDSVKTAGVLLSGTALLAFLNSCNENSNPVSINGTGKKVSLDLGSSTYSGLAKVGGVLALGGGEPFGVPQNGALIIRKSDTEFTVLDRTCTHQACQISGFNSNGISNCPCHGSQFNTEGKVVRGPASSALKKYSAALNGNILEIQF